MHKCRRHRIDRDATGERAYLRLFQPGPFLSSLWRALDESTSSLRPSPFLLIKLLCSRARASDLYCRISLLYA